MSNAVELPIRLTPPELPLSETFDEAVTRLYRTWLDDTRATILLERRRKGEADGSGA